MSENPVTSVTTRPAAASQSAPSSWLWGVLVVAAVAAAIQFGGLACEPHFADESAMIAQSYYYTLFKSGRWNHPDWLHYAAYDHPPLPKYLFGVALDMRGLPLPSSLAPWMQWIGGDFSPPADPRVLYWARVPAAVFGVGGAVAIYLIGAQWHGRLVGLLAALLLVLNPLYLTHARRAMSDSFTECLVIASVAVSLWGSRMAWRSEATWRWFSWMLAGSVLCGLAALAKLNGAIATIIAMSMLLGFWLGSVLTRSWRRRAACATETTGTRAACATQTKIESTPPPALPAAWARVVPPLAALVLGAGSFLVFIGLNPLLTARPGPLAALPSESRKLAAMGVLERARFLVRFRQEWTEDALKSTTFERDWLRSMPDRLRMTVWEGFGRFSPLGPRDIRTREPRPSRESFFDYRRSASLVWLPIVAYGFCLSLYDGWRVYRAGGPPLAWGVLWYAVATLAMVVFMIPLNWDRYYLPIQPPAALLAAYGIRRFAYRKQELWDPGVVDALDK